MLTRPSSLRSWVTLALSAACVTLAVLWPGWFTAFRAEGNYKDELAVVGNVAISTASVQSANISLRLGALRGGSAAQSGGTRTTSTSELGLDAAGADGARRSSSLGGLGVFMNGLGSLGNQGETQNEPAFDFHSSGFTLGADYKVLSNLILGLAFGYVNAQVAVEGDAHGHVSTTGYSLSAFGNVYIWRGWYADAIVTYGWNDIETKRGIAGVNETASAHTDGNQVAVSASTGYDFAIGALTMTPSVRVNYLKIHIDGYDERQTTASNLHVDRQSITSLTTSVGGQVSYAVSLPFGVVSPMLRFEWEHEYENDRRHITGRSLVTGLPFSNPTNHPDRNYFNLGAGATATLGHGLSAFFYYETILAKRRLESHSFTGGVRYEF